MIYMKDKKGHNMTPQEMKDTMYKFEQKYPNHRGIDISTRKKILDGTMVIIPLPNKKYSVVEKDKVEKVKSAMKLATDYNKKMKKMNIQAKRDMLKQCFNNLPVDYDLLTRLVRK